MHNSYLRLRMALRHGIAKHLKNDLVTNPEGLVEILGEEVIGWLFDWLREAEGDSARDGRMEVHRNG